MKNVSFVMMMFFMTVVLGGCAQTQGQDVYDASEVGKQSDIDFGKIMAVRHVKINEEPTGVGAMGGAAGGGLAGSNIGGGAGQIGGVIGGALLGGLIGSAAENSMMNKAGIEYLIRKDNGKTVSVVQRLAKDDVPLSVGQRVMIQTSGEYQKASGRGRQHQRVLPVDASIDDRPVKKKKG